MRDSIHVAGNAISLGVTTHHGRVFRWRKQFVGAVLLVLVGLIAASGLLWLGFDDDAFSANSSDNAGSVTATVLVR